MFCPKNDVSVSETASTDSSTCQYDEKPENRCGIKVPSWQGTGKVLRRGANEAIGQNVDFSVRKYTSDEGPIEFPLIVRSYANDFRHRQTARQVQMAAPVGGEADVCE